jgi:hypothetical protein
VVGGVRSSGESLSVAKRGGAVAYGDTPTLTCWYFSYWSGVARVGLEIYRSDHRVVFAFPTNDDLFAVFVGWPIGQLDAVRADTEAS